MTLTASAIKFVVRLILTPGLYHKTLDNVCWLPMRKGLKKNKVEKNVIWKLCRVLCTGNRRKK